MCHAMCIGPRMWGAAAAGVHVEQDVERPTTCHLKCEWSDRPPVSAQVLPRGEGEKKK